MRDGGVEMMKGETLKSVTGLEKGNHRVTFETESGRTFRMYHAQRCCENVDIEDICGDVADLIGWPLELSEKVSDYEGPEVKDHESYTWTFYKFATIKGAVTVRWFGSSSGYYSEDVDFVELT